MTEEIVAVAKSYPVGRAPDSIVVVIPKVLNPQRGQLFLVKKDHKGRIIYEPMGDKPSPSKGGLVTSEKPLENKEAPSE
jgi:hypothetical protein